MSDQKKQKSSSHDNRATAYLEPSNKKFIKDYMEARSSSQSQAINDAIRALKQMIKIPSKNSY